jgi:TetR/AcrR family transcriptional repressor of nem operon
MLIDSYLSTRHRDNRGSGCMVVAVGADMARLSGPGRSGYSRSFTGHLDRLEAALRLSEDPVVNRDRVTHLMSSLVGALLFARAIDDPVRSDTILHAMRRLLRREFSDAATAPSVAAKSASRSSRPTHDFLQMPVSGNASSEENVEIRKS